MDQLSIAIVTPWVVKTAKLAKTSEVLKTTEILVRVTNPTSSVTSILRIAMEGRSTNKSSQIALKEMAHNHR